MEKDKLRKKIKKYEYIFMLLVGFIFVILVLYKYLRETENDNWPSTNGIVTSSQIEEKFHDTREGTKSKKYPTIKYSYLVNNKKYTSTRFGNINGLAEMIAKRHPVGMKLNVYYNPQNPRDSVLYPGYSMGKEIIFLFIGLLLIILGFIDFSVKRKSKLLKLYNK